MGRSAVAVAIASAMACVGCGDDDGGIGVPTDVDFVLGSVSDDRMEFAPVSDGDDVPLVSGAQGGFHVWTGLRVRGAAGTLYLEREARRVSDDVRILLGSTVVLELPDEAADDWWERPDGNPSDALPSFMCPTPLGVRVRDQALHFRAQLLTEDRELLAEDELIVVPRCPEGAEAEFCAEICSG
jgi:hypothetical protein